MYIVFLYSFWASTPNKLINRIMWTEAADSAVQLKYINAWVASTNTKDKVLKKPPRACECSLSIVNQGLCGELPIAASNRHLILVWLTSKVHSRLARQFFTPVVNRQYNRVIGPETAEMSEASRKRLDCGATGFIRTSSSRQSSNFRVIGADDGRWKTHPNRTEFLGVRTVDRLITSLLLQRNCWTCNIWKNCQKRVRNLLHQIADLDVQMH